MLATCVCFFQAEDGIRYIGVTGVQTCALPIYAMATPPKQLASIELRDQTGWITFSIDGRYEIGRASCRERVRIKALVVCMKEVNNFTRSGFSPSHKDKLLLTVHHAQSLGAESF